MYYHFFPEEALELQEEMLKHPDLQEYLSHQTDKDTYIILNEIAAFCGLILDGLYTPDDILGIMEYLRKKLYERRTSIIITGH